MVELPDHPWFLATQFHPELKSRPNHPHPLFASFVAAALERREREGAARGRDAGGGDALSRRAPRSSGPAGSSS